MHDEFAPEEFMLDEEDEETHDDTELDDEDEDVDPLDPNGLEEEE
jgi:hypothetical protein